MAKRGERFADRESDIDRNLKKVKKLIFTLLDSVILLSFSSSIYFTYLGDYTKTILLLSLGCLLLMFFIVRGIIKSSRSDFFK